MENEMGNEIIVFGKDTCPFTTAAREALEKEGRNVKYVNVLEDPIQLDEMLKYSNGSRRVPVIVDGRTVTIGFKGRA